MYFSMYFEKYYQIFTIHNLWQGNFDSRFDDYAYNSFSYLSTLNKMLFKNKQRECEREEDGSCLLKKEKM